MMQSSNYSRNVECEKGNSVREDFSALLLPDIVCNDGSEDRAARSSGKVWLFSQKLIKLAGNSEGALVEELEHVRRVSKM